MSQQIFEVVLTGGPASGKTTIMPKLTEALEEQGFRVFLVPELATRLIMGGLSDLAQMYHNDFERFCVLEEQMFLMFRSERKRYMKLAKATGENCVIVFDRGEMDIASYVGLERFNEFVVDRRLSYFDVRDSYDAVIHLKTSAYGAEKFYGNENNAARFETLEEARVADDKVLNAWLGASHLTIIDNSTDFQTKLERGVNAVLKSLGLPNSMEIERKFLVEIPDNFSFDKAQKFTIEQTYLNSTDDVERRVRKRIHKGQEQFIYTEKRATADKTTREEIEKNISRRQYRELLLEKDDSRNPLHKVRYVFASNNMVWELDVYPDKKITILEVELLHADQEIVLPENLKIIEEVTDNQKYKNSTLAKNI